MENLETINQYQTRTEETAIYERAIRELVARWGVTQEHRSEAIEVLRWAYVTLGMVGETGEIANKVKKVIRDGGGKLTPDFRKDMQDEGGDVLWYLARYAGLCFTSLFDMARHNITKLLGRKERGVLGGSGDKR